MSNETSNEPNKPTEMQELTVKELEGVVGGSGTLALGEESVELAVPGGGAALADGGRQRGGRFGAAYAV